MNQDAEDNSLLEAEQISISHPSTTQISEKQVENVVQTLVQTTDTSISNSWTILSTSDELQDDMNGDSDSIDEDDLTSDKNSNSVVEQQEAMCIGPEGDVANQLNTESWLQVDDIKKSPHHPSIQTNNQETAVVDDGIENKSEPVIEETVSEVALPSHNITESKNESDQDVKGVHQSADDLLQTEEAEIPQKPTLVVESEQKGDESTETVAAHVEGSCEGERFSCNDKPTDAVVEEHNEKEKDETDDWVDILGNKLLMKKVVRKGEGSSFRAQRGQECHIHLKTTLSDGTLIDDEHKEIFVLGDGDLTSALDLSVNLMQKGEVSHVTSDAKYCYGEKGRPPTIPPNSSLLYEIELVDLQEGPYNPDVVIEKRLTWVDSKRNKGNQLYREKKFVEAVSAYTKCVRVIEQATNQEQTDDVRKQISQLNIKCQNNLSASYMMLDRWKDAMKACSTVLATDPKNVRAYFRKGKALAETGELKKAIQHLKRAAHISPNDQTIQDELTKQTNRLKTQNENQKKMYQRMFGGPASNKKEKQEENVKKDEDTDSWYSTSTAVIVGACAVAVFAIAGYFTAR